MQNYPTKEEILVEEIIFDKDTLQAMKLFKSRWVQAKKEVKTIEVSASRKKKLLKALVKEISKINKTKVKITFKHNVCNYNYKTKIININESLSIISTLHELGHHLFGESELTACRWSVWLFKKTFPISYKKLRWDGHILKKII